MKLTIDWCEEKVSSKGTKYKKASVTPENGTRTDDVAVFDSYSQYGDIAPGRVVEGVLKEKEYQGKKSYTLEDGNLGPKPDSLGGYKQKMINETMEKKNSSIREFQGNKEESIRLAGCQRDAVLLVTTFLPRESDTDYIKTKIIEWRDWLLSDDFSEHPPF